MLHMTHEPNGLVIVRRDGRFMKAFTKNEETEAQAFIDGFTFCATLMGLNIAGVPVFDKPEPTRAPSCDTCGEDGDIRIIHRPYGRPDHICAACFANADPENSFTDYPLAKEAA